MVAELAQRHHIEQFVQSAEPAGQDHECVRAIDHLALALEHVGGGDQLGDGAMTHFPLQQAARDQADHFAARAHRGIGDGTHEADVATAVDYANACRTKHFAQLRRDPAIDRVGAILRATKDADA